MNLQEVLDLNELNRNSYNTLERRTGLPFMKRGLVPGAPRDKYLVEHAVAVGCVLRLIDQGMSAAVASSAVDSVFDNIRDTVGMIADGHAPGWSMIHAISFVDGSMGFAYGAPDATSLREETADNLANRQSINVITVLKRLHARANATAEAVA